MEVSCGCLETSTCLPIANDIGSASPGFDSHECLVRAASNMVRLYTAGTNKPSHWQIYDKTMAWTLKAPLNHKYKQHGSGNLPKRVTRLHVPCTSQGRHIAEFDSCIHCRYEQDRDGIADRGATHLGYPWNRGCGLFARVRYVDLASHRFSLAGRGCRRFLSLYYQNTTLYHTIPLEILGYVGI